MARITKSSKIELSKKFAEEISGCDLIFVSFDGLNFDKIQTLRSRLKQNQANFKVMRNSVIYFGLKGSNLLKDPTQKRSFIKGPTAVIFVKNSDEISTVCKILTEFIKENPTVRIKGGFVSREEVSPDFVKEIAKVGSKKDLMFKIASSLYGAMLNMRWAVEAPIRELIGVLEALKDKREKETN